MLDFMAIGRIEDGENEVVLTKGNSHAEAAKSAALSILANQDESFDGDIYIDVVTDKEFQIERGFCYEASELR